MDSIRAFLEMGGYAAYVWPAFAVTFIVLAGILAVTLRELRHREAALAALQRNAAGPSASGTATRPRASEPGARA